MTETSLFVHFRGNVRTLDAETQRALYFGFRGLVYKDVYFLLYDHALSEDVVQESFMKAMAKGPKTRSGSNIEAWLRQVARNTAYDTIRKNKKYRQVQDLDSVYDYEDIDPGGWSEGSVEQLVETMLRDETLHEALRELKAEYRAVLLLHYLMGMSYAEIQRELGVTEQVLTQRLARARKKLAKQFAGKWGIGDDRA